MRRAATLGLLVALGCAPPEPADDGYPYPPVEASDPAPAWVAPVHHGVVNEVAVDGDGTVYAIDGGALYAWSAAGLLAFEQEGLPQSIAATAHGVVVARDGDLERLDPEGVAQWRIPVADICSVHVSGSRVGVLTAEALHQFGLADGELQWSAAWRRRECSPHGRARVRARPGDGWLVIGGGPQTNTQLAGFDASGVQDLAVEIPVRHLRDLAVTRDGHIAVAGIYDRLTDWGGLPEAMNFNAFGAVLDPDGELIEAHAFWSDWFQSANAIGSDGERFVLGGMFNEQNEGLEADGQRLTAVGEGEIGWIGAIGARGEVSDLTAVGSGGQLSVSAIAHSPRGRWVIGGVTIPPTEFEGTTIDGGGFVWVGPTL